MITDEFAEYCIRKYLYKILVVSFLVPIGVWLIDVYITGAPVVI